AGAPARPEAGWTPGDPRDHATARGPEAVLLALVRPDRAARRQGAPRRVGVHVSSGLGEAVPERRRSGRPDAGIGVRRRPGQAPRRHDRRVAHRSRRVSQLAQVHATPGLAGYMAEVEAGLAQAVAARPGLAQEAAGEALAARGPRPPPPPSFPPPP